MAPCSLYRGSFDRYLRLLIAAEGLPSNPGSTN
jgi:hypothetical protein